VPVTRTGDDDSSAARLARWSVAFVCLAWSAELLLSAVQSTQNAAPGLALAGPAAMLTLAVCLACAPRSAAAWHLGGGISLTAAGLMLLPGWRPDPQQDVAGAGHILTAMVALWLVLASGAFAALAWLKTEGPRLVQAIALAQGSALAGVIIFGLVSLIVGAADPSAGAAVVALWCVAVGLLTALMMVLGHQLDVAAHAGLPMRRELSRHVGELLGMGALSGLAVASLLGWFAGDKLFGDLSTTGEQLAGAMERHALRNAELVSHRLPNGSRQPADLPGIATALGLTLLPPPPPGALRVNIGQTPGLQVALLADRSIVLTPDGPESPLDHPLRLRAVPERLPGGDLARFQGAAKATGFLLCQHQIAADLICADMTVADLAAPLLRLQASDVSAEGRYRGAITPTSSGLAMLTRLGEQHAHLAPWIDQRTLAYELAMPLIVAAAGQSMLSLLIGLWLFRRRLPALRRMYGVVQRAETVVEHLPVGVLLIDAEGEVLQANPEAMRLCGQLEPMPLQRIASCLPADWPARADAAGAAAFDLLLSGQPAVQVSARCVNFSEGRRRQRLLLLQDSRPALQAAQDVARWQNVFHQAGWAIAITSLGDVPVFEKVNAAYGRMVDQDPQALVGQPVRGCVAPSHLVELAELRTRALVDGHGRAELRHRRRDGHEFATLVDLTVVADDAGQPSYAVVSVQDISAIKAIEADYRHTADQLNAVLDALPVGLWIADAEGRIVRTNPAVERLWGAQADAAAIGHGSLLRRAKVTREVVAGALHQIGDEPASARYLASTATPYFGSQGQTLGAVVVDEDQTAQRQGEAIAKESARLLDKLIQASVTGMALCDSEGQLIQFNLAWHAMFGTLRQPGHVLTSLLAPDELPLASDLIRRICTGQVPAYQGEHPMKRASGDNAWSLLAISRLSPGGRQSARALIQVVDIDARRRAMDALSTSQARLAAAQWIAGVGDWTWQSDADQVELSEQARRIIDFARGSATPDRTMPLDGLLASLHVDDRQRAELQLRESVRTGARFGFDCRLDAPGDAVEVHLQGVVHRDVRGATLAGTMQDVSERKRIERELRESRERLRELVAHEGAEVEEERKRIAREVHDELGQLVTALRMDMSMIAAAIEPTVGGDQINRMQATLRRMNEVVRHVASHLRPAALDLGLVPAIEWLAEDFSLRWELVCECRLPEVDELGLSEAAALALFRAVQESLTNIARHASASRVTIDLSVDRQLLSLQVQDDGHGFDTQRPIRAGGGLGLLGMRERMLAIGARLSISSGPQGTTVAIQYPLPSEHP